MKSLCVFCGSSNGKGEKYLELADKLGGLMASNDISLVYGGAQIGVMGSVANSCLKGGGKVFGVIPESLMEMEVGHTGITELFVVDSMHDRKAKMYNLSSAFVALPGGMGTLDELCEIVTWAQLQYHRKPIYVLNDYGFFDNLLKHFDLAVSEGFLSIEHRNFIKVVNGVDQLVEEFLGHF